MLDMMEGERPKRGVASKHQVIYQECDSDDEDYETIMLLKSIVEAEKREEKVKLKAKAKLERKKIPPLSPLQIELKQICRLGDKEALKTFLANNPEINLDFKDPDGGATLLSEVSTKTAQFTEIVSMLISAGADIDNKDSLGNTALHNSVLYYPSTQATVDLLLTRGADVTLKNDGEKTAGDICEDKDLKQVLKDLQRRKTQKSLSKRTRSKQKGYKDSPDLRKLVCDPDSSGANVDVKFNGPVVNDSPSLLKRKRKAEESPCNGNQRKRIRFCDLDSTGASIDPQFSDEEEDSLAVTVQKKLFSSKKARNFSNDKNGSIETEEFKSPIKEKSSHVEKDKSVKETQPSAANKMNGFSGQKSKDKEGKKYKLSKDSKKGDNKKSLSSSHDQKAKKKISKENEEIKEKKKSSSPKSAASSIIENVLDNVVQKKVKRRSKSKE